MDQTVGCDLAESQRAEPPKAGVRHKAAGVTIPSLNGDGPGGAGQQIRLSRLSDLQQWRNGLYLFRVLMVSRKADSRDGTCTPAFRSVRGQRKAQEPLAERCVVRTFWLAPEYG